ncbi:hypothetical protein LWE61_17115 [Sphingobium sufflavum]|uniref:hypothetical protein n=1 Tax=Sphingobium sufflavum TaxID=1129547 RepID=UPI001F214EAC|nr:hypothetical protein [Sphingobium sufflavum]MCE7798259.1 hypothetical protein [Sphingobium sufflavum]
MAQIDLVLVSPHFLEAGSARQAGNTTLAQLIGFAPILCDTIQENFLMNGLINLDRRVSRAAQSGKGICFSDEELDILVSIGAIEVLKAAAATALIAQAAKRQEEREEVRRLQLEGQHKEAAQLALARVRNILSTPPRIPQAKRDKMR